MSRVAVITGAAGGIGAGLAREAVRRGMQVVLADRDLAGVQAVADGIGAAATAVACDVTDPASCEALAEAAWAAHGQVDLLFNNAGVLSTGFIWEISPETWQHSLDVNIGGIVNGIRAFVPRLLAADRPARIINTASVGGFLPSPLMAPYSSTKFAAVALTESLAGELKLIKSKIEVSLLAPGPVKSGIFREPPPLGRVRARDDDPLLHRAPFARGIEGLRTGERTRGRMRAPRQLEHHRVTEDPGEHAVRLNRGQSG